MTFSLPTAWSQGYTHLLCQFMNFGNTPLKVKFRPSYMLELKSLNYITGTYSLGIRTFNISSKSFLPHPLLCRDSWT